MDSRYYDNRKLRECRKKAGLTQEAVAEAIDLTKQQVSRIELGDSCSPETLVRFAALLEQSWLDFLVAFPLSSQQN